MWCCVHVVHKVLWACVLCTCRACDVMYIWCHVHIVHVVPCTCGIVYTLYSGVVYTLCRWSHVHVMLWTCCACGAEYKWYYVHVVHMVLVYVWYCVHIVDVVLWAWNIMHNVVMVLQCVCSVCSTLCRRMHWVVSCTGCRCMCCMWGVDACVTWICMSYVVVCVWCTLCVCAHGWGEGTRPLSGVATNPMCYKKNQGRSKDRRRISISIVFRF